MFFFRRRDRRPDVDESAEQEWVAPVPSEVDPLVPVRIYTRDDTIVDGWTPLGSQRLSDLLNAEDELGISRVAEHPTDADWLAIDREDMILVAAPPHTSARQLRVHRQKREMRARCEHFALTGTVHLIPGNRLDRTVLRTRQHFLPITNAVVETAAEPGKSTHHDALLLNIVNVDEDLELSVLEN